MSRIVFVRHGAAASGFADDLDPALSELGQKQAEDVAEALAPAGPLPILVSPLRRCRETAAPLERRWGVIATVEPAVGEVESPTPDLASRGAWLRTFMASSWDDAGHELVAWRQNVIDRVRRIDTDTVIVSHFIAINAVVGHATGNPRVVCFGPDNCSRTVVEVVDGQVRVVDLGGQARTIVR